MRLLPLLPLALPLSSVTHAADYWWDGSGSDSDRWNQHSNWSTTSAGSGGGEDPGAADNAIFSGTNTEAQQDFVIHLNNVDRSMNSLTFSTSFDTQITKEEPEETSTSTSSRSLVIGAGGITLTSTSGNVTISGTSSIQKVDVEATASMNIDNNSSSLLLFNRRWTSNEASGTTTLSIEGSGSGGVFFNEAISDGDNANIALSIDTNSLAITTLESANTYSGGTVLNDGILAIRSSNALGSGTLTINGGTLASKVSSRSPDNAIIVGGDFQLGGQGNGINLEGTVDLGGATRAITIENTAEISGVISNGGLEIIGDSSTRRTTLSGTNTYSGPTIVTSGVLVVDGSIANSAVTVASGATLEGNGTVGAVNIAGTHGPGNSPGTTTVVGDYTLSGTIIIDIEGTTPGTQHDQVDVTGEVDITGATLDEMFASGTYVNGDLLFILLNDGSDAITGTFAGLNQGDMVTNYDGLDWEISYTADSAGAGSFTGGNDIALMAVTPVPEPNTTILFGGLGALAILRRRRS